MYYQKNILSQDLTADVLAIATKSRITSLTDLTIGSKKGLETFLTLDGLTIQFLLSSPTPFIESVENIRKRLFNRWSKRVFEGTNNYYRFSDNIGDYFVTKDASSKQLTVKVPFQPIEYYNYFDNILLELITNIVLKLKTAKDFISFDGSLPMDFDTKLLHEELLKRVLPKSFGLYHSVISEAFINVENIWRSITRQMVTSSTDQRIFFDTVVPYDSNIGIGHINLKLYNVTFNNMLAAAYIKQNYPKMYPKLVGLVHTDEWVQSLVDLEGAPEIITNYVITGNLGDYVFSYRDFAMMGFFPYLFMLIFNEKDFRYGKANDIVKVLDTIFSYAIQKHTSEENVLELFFDIVNRFNFNKTTIKDMLNSDLLKGDVLDERKSLFKETLVKLL